jgi:serine/threonine-protein kinase
MHELPCPLTQWPRFSALLDAAMEVPEAARAGWLESLSGDDAAVRPWLERVLGHEAQVSTGQFLRLPELGRDNGAFTTGACVGPYRLVEPLGEGGMGDVWRATRHDEGPQREVALKLPHAELLGGPFRQRFARERDMLAALCHPHIAQLYDAGSSADGHPYLALELVQGRPITEACSSTGASLERRIDLVIQVLEGLAYAHQRLIVHRDIKPSNVLVTPEGNAKLLDFGIAKMLGGEADGGAMLTQPQAPLATPAYAAPEQLAGGSITVATDLFAVGVLLFELCTGHRPFVRVPHEADAPPAPLASQRADAAAAGIKEESSSFLKQRTKKLLNIGLSVSGGGRSQFRKSLLLFFKKEVLPSRLRGDLDAVIAKAIALDPAARYASAESFAADLRRWRKQMPVQARRIGWLARGRRFARRNRLGVGLGVVLALAVAGGTAGIAWQAQRAEAEAHRAEAEAARATGIKEFMFKLFKHGDPRYGGKPSGRMTVRELLDIGAAQVPTAFKADPVTQGEMLQRFGGMYDMLHESARAERVYAEELGLTRALYGPDDPRVIDGAINLAWSYAEWSSPAEASATLESIREPILRRFGRESLQWAQWLEVRANALFSIAGARDEAMADALQSVGILERHFADDRELVDALFVLRDCQARAGDYAAALATGDRLQRLGLAIHDFNAMDEDTWLGRRGQDLMHLGRLEEADAALAETQAKTEQLVGRDSYLFVYVTDWRAELASLRGERDRADAWFREALDISQRAAAAHDASVLPPAHLGEALAREGRAAEAVPVLEASLTYPPQAPTPPEDRLWRVQAALGDAYDQVGRVSDARRMLLAAREAWQRFGPPSIEAALAVRERWARFLLEHGDTGSAAAEFRAVLQQAPATPSAPAALAQAGLARIALAAGDVAAADAASSHALALLEATRQDYDVRTRVALWLIRAQSLAASGRRADAASLAKQAASAAEDYDAPGSAELARARALSAQLNG